MTHPSHSVRLCTAQLREQRMTVGLTQDILKTQIPTVAASSPTVSIVTEENKSNATCTFQLIGP